MENVLAFEICGKMAHFRKFYTNSSSLSYSVPPRTVLVGLLAGILGYEKDSYYTVFNTENCKMALCKISRSARVMQTLNYLKCTKVEHFNGSGGPTQTPFEIIREVDGTLRYQVFFYHRDIGTYKEVKRRLQEKRFIYPPYMGSVNFPASVNWLGESSFTQVQSHDFVSIASVIPVEYILDKGIDFNQVGKKPLYVIKENMPCSFTEGREIEKVRKYILEENGMPLRVKLNVPYISVQEYQKNIVFM